MSCNLLYEKNCFNTLYASQSNFQKEYEINFVFNTLDRLRQRISVSRPRHRCAYKNAFNCHDRKLNIATHDNDLLLSHRNIKRKNLVLIKTLKTSRF